MEQPTQKLNMFWDTFDDIICDVSDECKEYALKFRETFNKCDKYFKMKKAVENYTEDWPDAVRIQMLSALNEQWKAMNNIVDKHMSPKSLKYVYLLQEREFIRTKENVYKIGSTKQDYNEWVKQHSIGTAVYVVMSVSDDRKVEGMLIQAFDMIFTKKTEFGDKYYQGDISEMLKLFNAIVSCENNNIYFDESQNNYVCGQ